VPDAAQRVLARRGSGKKSAGPMVMSVLGEDVINHYDTFADQIPNSLPPTNFRR
jgi:hypothetical protein